MRNILSFHKKVPWQPGENTIAYFPLKENQNDVLNNYTLPLTGTQEQIGFTFNKSGDQNITINSSQRFVSCWVKFNSYLSSGAQILSACDGGPFYNYYNSYSDANKRFQAYSGSSRVFNSDQIQTNANTWYHYAVGWDGTKIVCYLNGSKVAEGTCNVNVGTSCKFITNINVTFSELIYESVPRTAQEVLNYYNRTKKTYRTPRLPSAYSEVEYIESSGTQYIDTGLSPGSNIQTETKIEVTTTEGSLSVFGWTNEHWLAYAYYGLSTSTTQWTWGLNRSQPSGGVYSPTIGNQYEIVYNNADSQLIINGDNAGSTSGTTCINGYIVAISRRSNSNGKFKFFYFKMYDKDTSQYVRDFVPCYRKSDGEVGMYDLVTDQFFTNGGSGAFIKGPDVG